jgi:hypothetical protein
MGRILLNDLFDDKSAKRRIVLSTSEGKYTVRKWIDYWDPVGDYFQNYMTEIIGPMRSTYRGKSYGSNAIFIVEFKFDGEKDEVIPIYPRDYEIKKFKKFNLTREALESKVTLENFLLERVVEGSLSCAEIKVHDLADWRKEVYESETKGVIKAKYQNWFTYYIFGRIASIYRNYRIKKQNKL